MIRIEQLLAFSILALAMGLPSITAAQIRVRENTAETCGNRLDDDGDGGPDCADLECRAFVFCQAASPVAAPTSTRSLVWLQVTGVVTWAAVFLTGIGVVAGVGGSAAEIGVLAIPLAGPWMCIELCGNPEPYLAGLITDGAVQALGLVLLIIGSAVRVETAPQRYVFSPWIGPVSGGELTVRF